MGTEIWTQALDVAEMKRGFLPMTIAQPDLVIFSSDDPSDVRQFSRKDIFTNLNEKRRRLNHPDEMQVKIPALWKTNIENR
jgi:hypothetical protein